MKESLLIELELPKDLEDFRLPRGVHRRLQTLLDRQDQGISLTPHERAEAKGLVELSEFLSFLKLRARRATRSEVLN